MTFALVVVSATFVVVVAIAVLVLARLAPVRPVRGQRVTVHTKLPDDQTIHGVLVKEYRDRLILRDAEYVAEDQTAPIPGTVRIPTAAVSWIQEHE